MIIVSDTSIITNLFQIGEIYLLEKLFVEVIIPEAVENELNEMQEQKDFIKNNTWIKVEKPQNQSLITQLSEKLDIGESEAITLAIEKSADYLLIDEKKGRKEARIHNLNIIGILGVLILAKQEGFIKQVKPLLDRLIQDVNFYINPVLYEDILYQVDEN